MTFIKKVRKIMKLKLILSIISIVFLFSVNANAEIDTQKKANSFLSKYCIELVNAIEIQYKEQKNLIKRAELKGFVEKGQYIGAIAEIYSKLCKK